MAHTLLLADDSPTIHRLIALTFADQSVRVVSVSDGQEAIEQLLAERPDIVLADIDLPRVDGYGVANFVRSQADLKGVPVLLLRGAFDIVDNQRVRESGAAGVLVKPFEPILVINRVKELLGIGVKADRPAVAGRLVTPNEPTAEGKPADAAQSRPIDAAPGRPERPSEPAPAGSPPEAHAPAASSDQLRQQSGVGPERSPVGRSVGATDPSFDQLDKAFETLDTHLAVKTAPTPRVPAAIDPAARGHQWPAEPKSAPEAPEPVFEIDASWFEKDATSASGATAASHATGAAGARGANVEATRVSEPITPMEQLLNMPPPAREPEYTIPTALSDAPARVAPEHLGNTAPEHPSPPEPRNLGTPEPAGSDNVADAFAVLFAVEQGERPPSPPTLPTELSDDMVERIATRVAERLNEGPLRETVTKIVSEVSERLVREEIARIRSAAQSRNT